MLTIRGLKFGYGERVVFDGFDADFEDDKITCIMGASGCGKTTLLSCIGGQSAYGGAVDGAGKVSYVFQENRLIEGLTVEKNLAFVTGAKADRAQTEELLRLVRLEGLGNRYPYQLSGGEAARVSLARAFAYPSRTLLMDEPFSGLDLGLKRSLLLSFAKLHAAKPRTVVFVTHNLDEALIVADRILVLGGAPCERLSDVPIERNGGDDIAAMLANPVREEVYRALLSTVRE